MLWIDYPPIGDVVGSDGASHPIRQCSGGRFSHFRQCLSRISACLVDEEKTWQQLYAEDLRLKTQVDRALDICGLDANWLSFDQIEELLFQQWDADLEAYRPGRLVELNTPQQAGELKPGAAKAQAVDVENMPEVIAMLSVTEGIESAIELAYNVPIDLLQAILVKREEIMKKAERQSGTGVSFAGGNGGSGKLPQYSPEEKASMLDLLDRHLAAKAAMSEG